MWDYVIYSFLFIFGTLFADYLCSLIFESSRKAFQLIFEIFLFLIIVNYLLFTTLSFGNTFISGFLYFFFSFLSMIFSRVIGFLIFNRVLKKVFLNKSDFNKSSIKLAKSLLLKLSKDEVINYFKISGFSKAFIEHLDNVLKD